MASLPYLLLVFLAGSYFFLIAIVQIKIHSCTGGGAPPTLQLC